MPTLIKVQRPDRAEREIEFCKETLLAHAGDKSSMRPVSVLTFHGKMLEVATLMLSGQEEKALDLFVTLLRMEQ